MSTDTQVRSGDAVDSANEKRLDADPRDEKASQKNPKDEKSKDDKGKGAAQQAGSGSEGNGGEKENKPAGTDLMATVLKRAVETITSEWALNDAAIALQVNTFAPPASVAVRAESVTTQTLERVRRTFVAPQGLGRAWKVMAEQHLLLLRGAPGDGREHLATFLLDAFCDARVRIFRDGVLASFNAADLTEGGGHLWTGAIGDGFDRLVAESLASRLAARKAYFLALWPAGTPCPPALGDYVVDAGRPDLDEVLRRHLPPEAAALADDERVIAAREEITGAENAADLAHLLGRVARDGKPLTEALSEWDRTPLDITEWIGRLPDRQERAFALALAALNDLSVPSVVAGARLADELLQRLEDPQGRYGLSVFHRSTNDLLGAVNAECVPSHRETDYGSMPVTVVRLRRPGQARAMLDAFWTSFPYLQEVYFDWMDRLARHPDSYVRERVALAAGILAAYDFDFVRGRLLLGWAANADAKLRRAAATALRPAASDDRLGEIVWSLLDQWATFDEFGGRSGGNMRLTAAAALGSPVGAGNPDRALGLIARRLLPHRVNDNDYELWTDVALAVTELFGIGSTASSDSVLRHVASWADSKDTGPSDVAVAVLLGLAGKPPGRADGEQHPLPPLLRATGRSRENLEHAAALWRLAFGHPQLGEEVLRGLRKLAGNAGDGRGGGDELTSLIITIPRTNRDRRTLRFSIRRWTQDMQNPAPPISQHLLEVLSQEGEQ